MVANRPMRKSAVIIVITHKPSVSEWEEISLRQCDKVLNKHDMVLVCPRDMDTSAYTSIAPRLQIFAVNPRWLSSYTNFAHFKLSPILYKAYQKRYQYILFYELDAFVFRDELEQWCSKEYDYIGAPFFSGHPHYAEDSHIIGVGNGGFCLRNIDSHVTANNTFRFIKKPVELWSAFQAQKKDGFAVAELVKLLLKMVGVGNNTFYYLRAPYYRCSGNIPPEDFFWSQTLARVMEWYNVASVEDAISFSFEILPRKLYSMNSDKLPFGCHGWYRFDLQFWTPFIEAEGFNIPRKMPPTPSR